MFKRFLLGGGLLGTVTMAPFAVAQTAVDNALSTVGEWVETERMIVREREAWATERASVQNLLQVFEQELAALQEQIETTEADASAADRERAELLEQDRLLREMEDRVMEQLIRAEIRLKGLYEKLPPPVQQELRPLAVALPEDPRASNLALGQRIQPVAAMLTQIQRFNSAVTVVDDFREFEAGSPVQVQSIYFGLGAAFYVDGSNTYAGIGFRGANGWEWREDASLAPRVRDFLEIYGGTRQAHYIYLPVEIQR